MEVSYKVRLEKQLEAGLCAVGRFDGNHPAVACAAGACGQVLLYDPHDELQVTTTSGAPPLRTLNFNKTITALDAGPLDPARTRAQAKTTRGVTPDENDDKVVRDVLLVGLGSALMVYDVDLNSDIFYRECPDGVFSCRFCTLQGCEQPLAVVGGNCSVVGFGWQGTELFWNVAGDDVRVVAPCEGDLLVGSDDYEIRIFRKEESIYEISEADKVVALCSLGKRGRFAFGLANGTVGVYKNNERRWRVKSKNALVALLATQNRDVAAGWSSGAVTLRSASNGQVIYKDTFDAPLVSLVCADLKLSGAPQLIAVGVDGEIRGYTPAVVERDTSKAEDDLRRKREIEQLQAEKRRLVGELRALEEQPQTPSDDAQGIPPDTQISLDVAAPVHGGGFELIVATSNETYVVGVVVLDTDGGLFEGETLSCAPARPSDKLGIVVRPKKNFPASLKIQIHVAARPSSSSLHVFEVDYKLPKFCRFYHVQEEVAQPSSWVKFDVPTNVQRVAQYLTQAFVSTEEVECVDNQVTSYYVGLDGSPLRVEATKDVTGTQITISTNDLATAAEVVQDVCTSLDVHELESEASFPDESQRLKETLERVSTHNSIRVRLTAEMADGSSRVKALVLKAEDARLMADMPRMMRNYDELMRVNEELIAEYNKRATNHEALLAALKQVNQVVQRASSLRVGKAKARVVADARRAIKKGDAAALLSLIATGRTGPG